VLCLGLGLGLSLLKGNLRSKRGREEELYNLCGKWEVEVLRYRYLEDLLRQERLTRRMWGAEI
jgi:hypothetical protein